jgi:hypothetical protein
MGEGEGGAMVAKQDNKEQQNEQKNKLFGAF